LLDEGTEQEQGKEIGEMVRRILTFLVLLPALLPPGFVLCKAGCQMPMQAPGASAPHSCCHHPNDRILDNNEPGLGSDASPAWPSSGPCRCQLSNPARQGLQPGQVSRIDPSRFPDLAQLTFAIPRRGASLFLDPPEAMGRPTRGLEIHTGSQIPPLRI
jgi:hypothetical protein